MAPNLVDIDGNQIFTNKWYKIMLSDGSELGLEGKDAWRITCAPQPSGKGMVVRYRRSQSHDHTVYGWPQDDKGYIRGIGVGADGSVYRKNLCLSRATPPALAWYETEDSYGFTAKQLPGNRIALYGFDHKQNVAGLRVVQSWTEGEGLVFHGQQSEWVLPLDCAFVQVGDCDSGGYF
ncbi:hypothetical protein HWV62_4679 [Athelia sp. TMB]|nr:hypothetical protein HWV62_4679 [Athelia sp. TMB]